MTALYLGEKKSEYKFVIIKKTLHSEIDVPIWNYTSVIQDVFTAIDVIIVPSIP